MRQVVGTGRRRHVRAHAPGRSVSHRAAARRRVTSQHHRAAVGGRRSGAEMPTPITAGLTRRVDHHACRQRSDRSTAQPPRYPSSAPTPGRSEGWPITTACMVCAVRSRASTVGAWAFTCRRPPAAGNPVSAADWENIGRQLAAANPVACPEERRPSCRASRPSARTGFRSARFDKHRPSPPRAVAEGISAAKNQEHGRGTVARAPPRWSAAGQHRLGCVSMRCRELQESTYPEDFERSFRLAWVPDSRQLVVEYELPGVGVIPNVKAYRYVKARDEVTSTPRPQSQVKAQYASVVAQVSLRTIHELFEADTWGNVETVVLNGMVSGLDPRTGKTVRPCLVTVRTTRRQFAELDLAHVEPTACLKGLKASFSRSPAELTPVRPVLEFDMVDPRFVADVNVLDALDSRPNLMELSPTEFEGIISNLFSAMGLETKQTRPSRDGGVDCVAYDSRPILGGKVVIQAKRYRHTVGVSAVRDLFGTLQNEGASKGILVTTSGYGAASHEFANGKPIELIDGGGLLYLLRDHAGVQARIEPPDDWKDPTPDQPDQ